MQDTIFLFNHNLMVLLDIMHAISYTYTSVELCDYDLQ